MKYTIVFVSMVIAAMLFSCGKNKEYKPSELFTQAQQDSILLDVVRYTDEHIPDSIKTETRFEEKNKSFFKGLISNYRFKYLTKQSDGNYYYLIYKQARGVDDLLVGLGGTFTLSQNNTITALKEDFRMWRMPQPELDKKGLEVYEKFINHEPLTEYMNSEEKKYIEFPNDHVTYDAGKHEWKISTLY